MKTQAIGLKRQIRLFTSSFCNLIFLVLSVGLLLRIVLLFNGQTQTGFSGSDWLRIFLLGGVNDICVAIIGYFFIWLDLIFVSDKKYKKPFGYILWGGLILCFIYVTTFNTIFDDYGSVVPKIVRYFLLYKMVSFGLRLFIPSISKCWSYVIYLFIFFLYVLCILTNAVGEYFFWDEFGVRYNFIAVDYLIYTNEVIGNIMESYPIIPLFAVLIILSAGITYILTRKTRRLFNSTLSIGCKLLVSVVYFLLCYLSFLLLNFNTKFQNSDNNYANELQANGVFKFITAFKNSELKYTDFYVTLPQQEAVKLLNEEYLSSGADNFQTIEDTLPETHKNIVLISIESLSASFLQRYGNTENITPNLDRLMKEGLVLDGVYATGNRTVRGLEALTLCLPPSAGESIIKQPDNADLFSTGKVLKEKGYTVQFLYGGDSYFDNMETFFSGNGYQIIDKKAFAKNEINFQNIWGVCDEDMYKKALKVFNNNAKSQKPFFGHIMTVSNHRPFTYPEGKIDISPKSKSRNGGVKYTDFALGKFMDEAKKQPWFKNTVFVIIADHCASSAGKTEIPLDKYHIPALIYSPGFIQPNENKTVISQIDIMPTVFGLLHFSYESYFYGKDIYSASYKSKAFVATYQNLGYWQDNILTILSPIRKVEQFTVSQKDNYQFDLKQLNMIDSTNLKFAISNYQTAFEAMDSLRKRN